jgi:hypothetical protein
MSANLEGLLAARDAAIHAFDDNLFFRRLREGSSSREVFADLVEQFYHQTLQSSSSFALAGARCPISQTEAKEYLFAHAEEEKTHWRWTLDDLGALGRDPAAVTRSYPLPATTAYIAFNFHTAETAPVCRLALALVLEGIAAHYGPPIGRLLVEKLGVTRSQMTFVSSHSTTDAHHSVELADLFGRLKLSGEEWAMAAYCAQAAGYLYGQIYDAVALKSMPQRKGLAFAESGAGVG